MPGDALVGGPPFVCAAWRRLKRMLFPTTHFLLFFLVVAGVVAALEDRFTAKKAVLVIASYYFYAQWDWRFCFLLAGSTAVSYAAGLLIDRARDDRSKRVIPGVAV